MISAYLLLFLNNMFARYETGIAKIAPAIHCPKDQR